MNICTCPSDSSRVGDDNPAIGCSADRAKQCTDGSLKDVNYEMCSIIRGKRDVHSYFNRRPLLQSDDGRNTGQVVLTCVKMCQYNRIICYMYCISTLELLCGMHVYNFNLFMSCGKL